MYEIISTPEEQIAGIFSAEALKERRRKTADEALHQASKGPITIQCKTHQAATSIAGTIRTMTKYANEKYIVKQQGNHVHICSSVLAQSFTE